MKNLKNSAIMLAFALCTVPAATIYAQDSQPASAPAKVAETSESEDSVYMTVDGIDIMQSEIDAVKEQLKLQLQQMPNADELVEEQLTMLEDNMIKRNAVISYGRKNGVSVSDADVDATMQEISKQVPSQEQFEQMLKQQGMTMADFVERMKSQLEFEKSLEKFQESLPEPSEEKLQAVYQENIEYFTGPAQIRASHILIPFSENEANQSDEAKAAARQETEKLIAELEENPDQFADLAKEHSSCPSSANGGDLSYFGEGQMVPAFEKAAFALEVDQISGVVESPFGFHIIKKTDNKEAGAASFEDVKVEVTNLYKNSSLQDWVEELAANAVIEK